MKVYDAPDIYEKIISENETGTEQIRLTINEFRDVNLLVSF